MRYRLALFSVKVMVRILFVICDEIREVSGMSCVLVGEGGEEGGLYVSLLIESLITVRGVIL